jgi:hypothetical protein
MRIWCLSFCLAWSWVAASPWATPLLAQEQFPYTAYLLADDVYVRSGPGRDYYPTQKLARTETVEVYRHDPGGWLAIRPPQGSFAWVSARYVEPVEGSLGKVTAEETVARVGSEFSTVRDVIQVRLEKGELVEIMEAANTGGQTWYKIAPPSGEFRWISSQYVDRRPPHDGVSQPRSEQIDEGDREIGDGRGMTPSSVAAPAVAIPAEATSAAFENSGVRTTSAEAPIAIPRGAEAIAVSPQQTEQLLAHLDQLELELSVMAAEEPTVWRFDEIAHEAELLLGQAGSAIERGRVRRVMHRIATLEDIKSRYDRIVGVQAETDLVNRSLDSALAATEGARLPAAAADNFDATGLLRPVVSRRAGAPNYAVVDAAGNVTAFLSPGPDVNLQPYLVRQVGVLGARSFIPEYQRTHVMVNRVTPLDATSR